MKTLLIPAAGIGSRLGMDGPKAMQTVAGRPMLDWLLDLHRPHVDSFVLVVRPEHAEQIHAHAKQVAGLPVQITLQEEPTGMLDAILTGLPTVTALAPDWVWITWCDQVAISALTVQTLARICDATTADLVLPTAPKPTPYVHLERGAAGTIERVLHMRDGDTMPASGEQDAGLFALRGFTYLETLSQFADSATSSPVTGERNFLPFIPYISARGGVETFPVDATESVGVNDPQDLQQVEEHLRGLA